MMSLHRLVTKDLRVWQRALSCEPLRTAFGRDGQSRLRSTKVWTRGLPDNADERTSGEASTSEQSAESSYAAWEPRINWKLGLPFGAAGFSFMAVDVFHPDSAHLFDRIDFWGHSMAQSFGTSTRLVLYDVIVSDAAITMGLLGWAICTLALALDKSHKASKPAAVMGIAWAFYAFLAGPVDGDPWLVLALKNYFMRPRPSPIHHTFSFPSGHTTSATFLVSALLFVMLPMIAARQPPRSGWWGTAQSSLASLQGSWPLFFLAWATTATGRVLADAHWVSDTVAAGFLSIAVTSALAGVAERMLRSPGGPAAERERSRAAGGAASEAEEKVKEEVGSGVGKEK